MQPNTLDFLHVYCVGWMHLKQFSSPPTTVFSFSLSPLMYFLEFSRLCQQWGAVEWNWMTAFKIDMALYKGDHELYRKLLQTEREKIKPEDRDVGKVSYIHVYVQLYTYSLTNMVWEGNR